MKKAQKALQIVVHGGLYLLGIPFYLGGGFIAIMAEAFMQGFIQMTSKLKQL